MLLFSGFFLLSCHVFSFVSLPVTAVRTRVPSDLQEAVRRSLAGGQDGGGAKYTKPTSAGSGGSKKARRKAVETNKKKKKKR